ncbi:MAG: hypothetical protein J0G28_01725 [Afipia sp.]|nr:hypothetical protein [Afipia sp.]OJW66051.1 MAG: hypothetical protein BGO65_03090 [Afipia sp. 64-13]
MRKLIAFDEETWQGLRQLERDRMATLQELADEAFADLLKKHGVPLDLRDALHKSASAKTAQAAKRRGKRPVAVAKRRAAKAKTTKRTQRTRTHAVRAQA